MNKDTQKNELTTLLSALKRYYGKFYCKSVIKALDEKNIFNAKGKSFSNNSIQKIMGGFQRPNEMVIDTVIELIKIKILNEKKRGQVIKDLKTNKNA